MICPQCGAELQPGTTFCTNCGCAINAQVSAYPAVDPQQEACLKKGKTAMILGIVGIAASLLCSCLGVPGLVCAVIAIVMAVQARNEAQALGINNSNATVGLVLGVVTIVLSILGLVVGCFSGFLSGFMQAIMEQNVDYY